MATLPTCEAVAVNRVVVLASAAAAGLVIGRFSGVLFVAFLATAAFLVAVGTRVVSQERTQQRSRVTGVAFVLGVGLVAGKLMDWFGLFGGTAALVLLFVALFAAGGDLM